MAIALILFFIHGSQALVFNTSSRSCDFSRMPPSEPIPACAPNASAMIDEAIARAWEFAPVVHFHTLEETPLQVSLGRIHRPSHKIQKH